MNDDDAVTGLQVSIPGRTAVTYARIAGFLFLLSVIGGGFGEAYVPSKLIVSTDANATANNVHVLGALFRWGFVAYLLEALCDIALALVFYRLLRPVQKDLSLLAALFGVLSTAVFGGTELFYFAPILILSGAPFLQTFSADQLNSLALLSFRIYAFGSGIFMAFYGIAWVIRGYLMFRSDYFPKSLGLLMAIGGAGFMAKNLTLVLKPTYAFDFFLLPMFVGGLSLMIWLLVKGLDASKWDAKLKFYNHDVSGKTRP